MEVHSVSSGGFPPTAGFASAVATGPAASGTAAAGQEPASQSAWEPDIFPLTPVADQSVTASDLLPPAIIHFQQHEASGRWMVIVADRRTGDVLRTMPPEELLDAIGHVKRMIGLMLDDKV